MCISRRVTLLPPDSMQLKYTFFPNMRNNSFRILDSNIVDLLFMPLSRVFRFLPFCVSFFFDGVWMWNIIYGRQIWSINTNIGYHLGVLINSFWVAMIMFCKLQDEFLFYHIMWYMSWARQAQHISSTLTWILILLHQSILPYDWPSWKNVI